jgi:hypothetical protein
MKRSSIQLLLGAVLVLNAAFAVHRGSTVEALIGAALGVWFLISGYQRRKAEKA